jgi:hypothetical protein
MIFYKGGDKREEVHLFRLREGENFCPDKGKILKERS